MEFGGLVIELFAIFGIPLLILIFIGLFVGKVLHNEKIKKIILFLFSLIYNAIVGVIGFLLFFCLIFLFNSIFNIKITLVLSICIFAIILIPINIYIIKKGKLNPILYIVLNIIIFVLSFINSIAAIQGSIDL